MKRGFTLIELLVVIAIIGLLSTVIFASLSAARTKAIDSYINQQVLQYTNALKNYHNEFGHYPNVRIGGSPVSNDFYCLGSSDCLAFDIEPPPDNSSFLSALKEYFPNSYPDVEHTEATFYDSHFKGLTYNCRVVDPSTLNCQTAQIFYMKQDTNPCGGHPNPANIHADIDGTNGNSTLCTITLFSTD